MPAGVPKGILARLNFFETSRRLPEDKPIDSGYGAIAIIGMGGIDTSAYDEMRRRYGDVIIGIDFNTEKVEELRKAGRNVVHGDASDSDFWERIEPANSLVMIVMLALPDPRTVIFAIHLEFQFHIDQKSHI